VAVNPCWCQKRWDWFETCKNVWYCLQLQWLNENTASELHGKQQKCSVASRSLQTVETTCSGRSVPVVCRRRACKVSGLEVATEVLLSFAKAIPPLLSRPLSLVLFSRLNTSGIRWVSSQQHMRRRQPSSANSYQHAFS
jgi:hypothetical protein